MNHKAYRVTYTINGSEIIVFDFSSTADTMEFVIEEAVNKIRIDQPDYHNQVEDLIGFSILCLPSYQ